MTKENDVCFILFLFSKQSRFKKSENAKMKKNYPPQKIHNVMRKLKWILLQTTGMSDWRG